MRIFTRRSSEVKDIPGFGVLKYKQVIIYRDLLFYISSAI